MRWTDVLVGPTPGLLGTQGQQRLGTVQRLDAGLFIDAEHQRMLGRVQVEADDVQQFGQPRPTQCDCATPTLAE
jgi:hypothetical protein